MTQNWVVPYVLNRLVWAVATVFAILVINFLVIHLAPGDPIQALVGDFPAPPEYVEKVRRDYGLDQPLLTQLWLYFANLAEGNLGFSFIYRQPVLDLILGRAPNTLLLMIPGLAIAALIGVVLALAAAPRAGGATDSALTAISLFGYSVPVFWLAQVLIVVLAVGLGLFPTQGMFSLRAPQTGIGHLIDQLWHLILPVFCVMTYFIALVARVARASVLQAMHEDYVLTARAKGLAKRRVLWRHILPNALIPVVTIIGYNFGYSLTGAILVESVFAWPGLGGLFISSITNRDYPVLEGIFLFSGTLVVLANLVTDLLYTVIDPRVRYASKSVS